MIFNNTTTEETTDTTLIRFEGGMIDAGTADQINTAILCYLQPIISLFGIVGNALSFIILFKERKKHRSKYMLAGLASSDTLFLLARNYDTVVCIAKSFDQLEARNLDVLMTPIMTFVPVVFARVTGYITGLAALERFVAFSWPFFLKLHLTSRTIMVAIFMCYLLPILFHIPVFLRNTLVWKYNSIVNETLPYVHVTEIYLDNKEFFNTWKNLVLNVFFYLLPVSVVMTTATVTTFRIRRMRNSQIRKTGPESSNRATKMLTIVSLIYLVTSLPGIVMLGVRFAMPEFDYYGREKYLFIVSTNINGIFLVINSSVNFIVYCLAGESFREVFLKTFCSIGKRKRSQSFSSMRSSSQKTHLAVHTVSSIVASRSPVVLTP